MAQQGLFGNDVNDNELRELLVEEILETHRNHVEAQVTSKQRGSAIYSQIWRALPKAALQAAGRLSLAVTPRTPGRAPYQLPVIGDKVLAPWRPPGGGDPSTSPFLTSAARTATFQLHPDPQAMFDLDLRDEGEAARDSDAALATLIDSSVEARLQVVLVAVESDEKRLRRITWGLAEPLADGVVRMHEAEVIYRGEELVSDGATRKVAVAGSFDEGSVPKPVIKKREIAPGVS